MRALSAVAELLVSQTSRLLKKKSMYCEYTESMPAMRMCSYKCTSERIIEQITATVNVVIHVVIHVAPVKKTARARCAVRKHKPPCIAAGATCVVERRRNSHLRFVMLPHCCRSDLLSKLARYDNTKKPIKGDERTPKSVHCISFRPLFEALSLFPVLRISTLLWRCRMAVAE